MTQVLERQIEHDETESGQFLFTREQFHALLDKGILTPPQRYELVEGIIYRKMTQNPPHRITLMLVTAWLESNHPPLTVQGQATIDTGRERKRSEPDPDIAVTREPTTSYRTRNPGPDDIVLVVEVSDKTLRFDMGRKARLYAGAGIVEYWVLDVVGRRLFVHREPSPAGYPEPVEYGEEAEVATLARPEARVRVGELLPPVEEAKAS